MSTRRRLRALLPVLAASVTLVTAMAAPAALADGPVGGPRLAGPDVATASPADPAPPPVSAASYVVADVGSGAVLAAKDPHGQYAPASTLKTLTAVTLIPRLDPGTLVTPTRQDVGVDGSKVGLVTDLAYTVKDLFTALLVVSGNDAAGALGTAVGGQQVATGLMNTEAARLQAFDTHAVNTSGLDAPGQVSSAYDLALIARAGLALPDFRAYVGTRRSFIPAPGGRTIEIDSHNRLLGTYDGALGVKNGFTEAARASFVGAASRNGHTLVVTLMRADPAVWKDAAALLDWGFAATLRGQARIGQLVSPVPPPTGPAPRVSPDVGLHVAPVATSRAVGDEGTSPVVPLAAATGLLGALVVLRRRTVVKTRAKRRAATRRPPARPAEVSVGRAHVRAVSRR